MSLYNWETSGHGQQRKKVKKTGTVVLHTDDQVDTSFARLQKEVTVERLHHSQKEAEEALAQPHHDTVKTALMTAATATALEEKMKFTALLPSQAQCYRGIFNGRDVILHSRTGSGKTLAYALPIIERHLLLERHRQTDAAPGPFLLIFVFSNDLAMQTRSVLTKIYGAASGLRIAVAGFDSLEPAHVPSTAAAADGAHASKTTKKSKKASPSSSGGATTAATMTGNAGAVDILIGTVRTLDEAIRGHKVAAAATAEEEAEAAQEARLLGKKHPRSDAETPAKSHNKHNNKNKNKHAEAEENESDAEVDESDDEDAAGPAAVREAGVINPARVRAVVVDEVDTTLGPRFSSLGRRMKNLLKFIRRANGALSDGLLNDFRAHHYVLCGATIPNWVLKAGFLGVKKYYYQLVAVGTQKLPAQLECFQHPCDVASRVATAVRLLTRNVDFTGRVVVFGTPKQLTSLEAALKADSAAKSPQKISKQKAHSSSSSSATAAARLVVRALTSDKDEAERVAAIEDFNCGVAQILLCTDVAARGLDFLTVDTVLMLNLPRNALAADTFVHRAGRTARVGRAGRCVLLHDASEAAIVDAIVKSTHIVLKALPTAVAATLVAETAATSSSSSSSPASSSSSPDAAAKKAKSNNSATSPTADALTMTTLRLVVRNPFRYTKPNVKVPSAMQILNANVDDALRAQLVEVAEEENSNGEVVRFRVPASHVHEVKQQLWKYTLQEG